MPCPQVYLPPDRPPAFYNALDGKTCFYIFDQFIPMLPIAKARPRVTKNGTFTPKRTKVFAQDFCTAVAVEMMNKKIKQIPAGAPLQVRLDFYFGHKKNRGFKTTRPDADNLAKACCDALNGVLYHDDGQIVSLRATKQWGERDGIYISVMGGWA